MRAREEKAEEQIFMLAGRRGKKNQTFSLLFFFPCSKNAALIPFRSHCQNTKTLIGQKGKDLKVEAASAFGLEVNISQ